MKYILHSGSVSELGGKAYSLSCLEGGGFNVPAREMLADMLFEQHQPAPALAEYESELKITPNRFNALYGAATAADMAGDSNKAKSYYSKLREICPPQADREELQKMKIVAAGNN